MNYSEKLKYVKPVSQTGNPAEQIKNQKSEKPKKFSFFRTLFKKETSF